MLRINQQVAISDAEYDLSQIRAQGAGGQNVNKVATAIHLRFDILASSLPEHYKQRLMAMGDRRISKEGVVVIKAQNHRTVEKNKADAVARLQALIERAGYTRKIRKPSKPSKAAKKKRLDNKNRRAQIKSLRGKVQF